MKNTNKSEYSARQRMYWDLAIMISNHIEEHLHQARSEAWDAAVKYLRDKKTNKKIYLSQFK